MSKGKLSLEAVALYNYRQTHIKLCFVDLQECGVEVGLLNVFNATYLNSLKINLIFENNKNSITSKPVNEMK